jgi:hypothetical protein
MCKEILEDWCTAELKDQDRLQNACHFKNSMELYETVLNKFTDGVGDLILIL